MLTFLIGKDSLSISIMIGASVKIQTKKKSKPKLKNISIHPIESTQEILHEFFHVFIQVQLKYFVGIHQLSLDTRQTYFYSKIKKDFSIV